MSRFPSWLGVLLMVLPTVSTADEGVACLLSPTEFSDRKDDVVDLLAGNQGKRELEDGYEFRFPGDGDWATRLFAFIEAERRCCPFFAFELSFEPNGGAVAFRVRGSAEVKVYLETLMADAGL